MNTSGLLVAAAEGGNGFWIPADFNEVIWNSTAFFIVAALMWKFLRKPVAEFFRSRAAGISGELDASTATRTEAEVEHDRIRTALAGADDEANQILVEAREAAARITAELEQRTVTDIANVRAAHEAEIIELRTRAEADLSADLAALSLGSAELVVQRSLDATAQQRLIDNYIDGIGAN